MLGWKATNSSFHVASNSPNAISYNQLIQRRHIIQETEIPEVVIGDNDSETLVYFPKPQNNVTPPDTRIPISRSLQFISSGFLTALQFTTNSLRSKQKRYLIESRATQGTATESLGILKFLYLFSWTKWTVIIFWVIKSCCNLVGRRQRPRGGLKTETVRSCETHLSDYTVSKPAISQNESPPPRNQKYCKKDQDRLSTQRKNNFPDKHVWPLK
jgi:hypothetical protein